jgi:hypothetical protein
LTRRDCLEGDGEELFFMEYFYLALSACMPGNLLYTRQAMKFVAQYNFPS